MGVAEGEDDLFLNKKANSRIVVALVLAVQKRLGP